MRKGRLCRALINKQEKYIGTRCNSTSSEQPHLPLAKALNQNSPESKILAAKFAEELTPAAFDVVEYALATAASEKAGAVTRAIAKEEMLLADSNKDGVISPAEFDRWFRLRVRAHTLRPPIEASATVGRIEEAGTITSTPPTSGQLWALAIRTGVPFVCFGFVDNFLMILCGSAIEDTFGLMFGLTTLAAAGLGNMSSDVVGIGVGRYIESAADALRLPDPKLNKFQIASAVARRTATVASMFGIALGCILGMFPLLFRDEESAERQAAATLMKVLDTDKDGYISAAEASAALLSAGLKTELDEVKSLLTGLKPEEAKIDAEELARLISSWRKLKASEVDNAKKDQ